MVLLHNQNLPSRKRPPNSNPNTFISPLIQPPKIPKSSSPVNINENVETENLNPIDKMTSVLAEAGCTLINPLGPPCLPSDTNKLRHHLHRLFSSDSSLKSDFLSGFSSYVNSSPENLRRVLLPSHPDSCGSTRSHSLVRVLLLVPSIQLDLQNMLLETLPEYFDTDPGSGFGSSTSLPLHEDVARLILNQFRWLEFLVDSETFTDKLLQVLCICPLHLKKEIIGSLPEIIGDQNNKIVVDSLERMLQEDHSIIVPILDSFSNLNLDDQLQEKILCQEILKELKCVEKARDHKVIDIWFLMLIYMNSETMQKSVEKVFKKKIIEGHIQDVMFDQCICGNKELVQDYFSSFLSLSAYLLACKEQKPRDFGIRIYKCLFEEFADTYSRQEILGALVTHVGSGISFEVSSALEVMVLLASKYSHELIPLSSHISGILDYLEGFSVECLHKVYEVFCLLALSARSTAEPFESSIANELLMIVRKQMVGFAKPKPEQVNNPDMKYKKIGIIGTLKIVSYLGDASNTSRTSSCQKSNYEEAMELLKTSMDFCKQLPLPLILLYDELVAMLDCKTLHPTIMEWIGNHVGEFESKFLSDLEGGVLPAKGSYCGLEGELWMNLDGDISPICLNILLLVSSSCWSASSLQILPANFLLLSVIERLTNQGSLGGIDALLGCPLHLPSSKIFCESAWKTLSGNQKQVIILSLYYAANWMRELLNVFCTQVTGRFECISQATKDEIVVKLFKRLRNLVYLESLLNKSLKDCPLSLPELFPHVDPLSSSPSNEPSYMEHTGKKRWNLKSNEDSSQNRKKENRKNSNKSNSDNSGKYKQPTILDVLRKAGAVPSQEVPNEDLSCTSSKCSIPMMAVHNSSKSSEPENVEVSEVAKILDGQRYKFRPLSIECFSILAFSKNLDSCCADPAAELPLHLYLLRDLHKKLDYFSPPSKQSSARFLGAPPGFNRVPVIEFLSKIRSLFPTLKKHLDCAVCILQGAETCEEHWKVQSTLAGNPDIANIVLSKSSVSSFVFKEILYCLSKILNVPDIQMDKSILSDILQAFQPIKIPDCLFSVIQVIPSGSTDYLYCGAYIFLEGLLDIAISFSFTLAAEVLLALESVLSSFRKFIDKPLDGNGNSQGILPTLRNRLGTSAQKLLQHNNNLENDWKGKGEIIQKTLHIYLENCECTSDLLDEFACSILPKVSSCGETLADDCHGFPTLCSATFVVCYSSPKKLDSMELRESDSMVQHEENLGILNKLVKQVVLSEKPRAGFQVETIVETLLKKLVQCVNVVVSLINACRTNPKVNVRAMAVKYGGKFVDSFLKGNRASKGHKNHTNPVLRSKGSGCLFGMAVSLFEGIQLGSNWIQPAHFATSRLAPF
ncbi:hypothetical protein LguiB_010665 [Lonicera macranthoides]